MATAKKKAVVDYIDEQVALLTEKRSDFIKKLEALSAVDIESE